MHGIYKYTPEMNHISSVCNVAAILWSHFMVCVLLLPMINILYFDVITFRSMCTVPSMAVFCSPFTSWFPGMVLRHFLNDFETVQVSPNIIGFTFVFANHKRYISTARSSYFKIFLICDF